MFLATDHSKQPSTERPRQCTFPQNDWHILAGFWHPIAFAHDIGDEPTTVTLLDVALVVYRTSSGITVAKDLCPHRGTKISGGRIQADCLVCPMHGLHFDAAGRCTRIPSIPDRDAKIPDKLRLQTYQSVERYGIVWTCLKDEPIWPVPEWADLEANGSEYELIYVPVGEWNAAASRETENFIDVAHHSFVHTKTFGNPDRPQIPQHEVQQTDFGLRLDITCFEVERGWHDPEQSGERETDYRYDLTFPFAKDLYTEGKVEGIKCHFYDVASPVSATKTRIFQINLTNNLYCSKDEYWNYQVVTNEEDRVAVETQHPEEVPLDLREEIHIPADRFSLEYRRALVERFGLGSPDVAA